MGRLKNSSIEPDGESRTSFDFDPAILLDFATPTNEQQEIVIDGRKSVQFSICSQDSIHDKWRGKLDEDAEIVVISILGRHRRMVAKFLTFLDS